VPIYFLKEEQGHTVRSWKKVNTYSKGKDSHNTHIEAQEGEDI
jgi:hypothetical protein